MSVLSTDPRNDPDETFTYFDIGSVDRQQHKLGSPKQLLGRDMPSRARQLLQVGDILFSTVRTNLSNVARVEEKYLNPIASTGFAVLRPAKGLSTNFLVYQLISSRFINSISSLQSGSSYPAVRATDVFNQQVVIPPTEEQIAIGERLEAVFSATVRSNAAAQRGLKKLVTYRRAVLNAAVTGALTKDWRSKNRHSSEHKDRYALRGELLRKRRLSFERDVVGLRVEPEVSTRSRSYSEPQTAEYQDMPVLPDSWSLDVCGGANGSSATDFVRSDKAWAASKGRSADSSI